jgi:hypothetical protein
MARALYGHLGGDAHLSLEIARLRGRVSALEAELEQLRAAHADEDLARELHELATSTAALA